MVQKLVNRITGEYVEREALHQTLRKNKRRVVPEIWSAKRYNMLSKRSTGVECEALHQLLRKNNK